MYVTHTRSSLPVVDYTVVVIVINILWLLCVHRSRTSKLSTPQRYNFTEHAYAPEMSPMPLVFIAGTLSKLICKDVDDQSQVVVYMQGVRYAQLCNAVCKSCIKLLLLFC